MLAAWHVPGFLKLILFACLFMRVCISLDDILENTGYRYTEISTNSNFADTKYPNTKSIIIEKLH